MSLVRQSWINDIADAAQAAGHIWPHMASCEAALESGFGSSALAKDGLNLFGLKVRAHSTQCILRMPTKEFENGDWVTVSADWVKYDTLAQCFADRMATLARLAPYYPHYAAALDAVTPFDYVDAVSQTWSTSPTRAQSCKDIYAQYFPALNSFSNRIESVAVEA